MCVAAQAGALTFEGYSGTAAALAERAGGYNASYLVPVDVVRRGQPLLFPVRALPLGVQFVGPYRGDSTVLLAADAAWKTISR